MTDTTTPPTTGRRGPWIALLTPLISSGLWAVAFTEFEPRGWTGIAYGVLQIIVGFLAGPAVVVALVIGVVSAVTRCRLRSLSIVGVVAGLVALAYIGLEFFHLLATAAFA